MDRNPALHPQGDSTPMPCHGEQVFDPKSVGVAQENRQSGQKEHEASLRYQNPVNLGSDTSMLRQPETKPISHDQLVVEVKGIYAGLVKVEAKCIEVDEQQKVWAQNKDYASRNPVTPDQWSSLIAMHKQLSHEHHDFFLASQHPSASNNLSRLAAKYIMPPWMRRLAQNNDYALRNPVAPDQWRSLIALHKQLLHEHHDFFLASQHPSAIDNLSRLAAKYIMLVARYWYCIAGDQSPETGRLYHHLEKRQLKLPGMGVVRTERIRSLKIRLSSVSRCTRFGKKSNTRRIKLRADAPMVQYGQVLGNQEKPAGRAEETPSITRTAAIYGRHTSPDSFPRDESWKLERAEETSSISSTPPIYDPCPPDESWKFDRAEETSSISSTPPIYDPCPPDESWRFDRAEETSSISSTPPIDEPFLPYESWKLKLRGDKPEKGGASHSSFPRLPLLNLMRRILTGAILLQVTMGMPTNSTALETSTISHEDLYVGFSYIFFAVLFIGAAERVSRAQGAMMTHGIAMGVGSLGWWLIANDNATSIGLRFIVLLLWTISTWQFFNAASARLQLPRWATLGSLVLAPAFDICVVRTMTPSSVAMSQNDILTLSLPSMSLVLGVTVITFTVIQVRLRRQDGDRPPPPQSTGGDPSIDASAAGGDPSIDASAAGGDPSIDASTAGGDPSNNTSAASGDPSNNTSAASGDPSSKFISYVLRTLGKWYSA